MAKRKLVQLVAVRTYTKSELFAWAFEQGRDLDLPTTSRFVLIALTHYAGYNTRECWPSVSTLAQDTGLGKRTVGRALADLSARELITRWQRGKSGRRGRTSNGYRINISRLHLSRREVVENRMRIAEEHSRRIGDQLLATGPLPVDKWSKPAPGKNDLTACVAVKSEPVDKWSKPAPAKAAGAK